MRNAKFLFSILAIAATMFVAQWIWFGNPISNFMGTRYESQPAPGGQSRFNPADMSSRTFQNMPQEFTWQAYFNKLAPQPGDTAPDFELYDITGTEVVKLSDFRGRQPVALIFGSFT